ncbi:MAG: DNA/RNA non-specific endonuclease [Spirosomataceae bacterium]
MNTKQIQKRLKRSSWLVLLLLTVVVGCEKNTVPNYGTNYAIFANPTGASVSSTEDYLMPKRQYTVAYNSNRLTANWVSWTINRTDLGTSERQNDFRPDTSLPAGWYQVKTSDYTNSGFDRGHLCPSADRTASEEDNSATFLMTNIVPQSPRLNRFVWANLEEYCRDLVRAGYFVNVLAGVYGKGGEGSLGRKEALSAGVVIPERMYKLVIAVPSGSNWTAAESIHLVADFPNKETEVQRKDWVRYLTSLTELEKRMGKSIQSGLPKEFVQKWHGDWWDFSDSSVPVSTKCDEYNGQPLYVGLAGDCFYVESNGQKKQVDKGLCDCL